MAGHASALWASLLIAFGWAGWHVPLFAFSPGRSSLGALFHAALDIFISSPVAATLPNVMGALLTVGTLLLILICGRRDLSWRSRITEPACT